MQTADQYPLPEDPALAAVAEALAGSGHWGFVADDSWRIVYVTDELRLTFGGNVELAEWPIGTHFFGPEFRAATAGWRFGTTSVELFRTNFEALGGWVLSDTPGGIEELRTLIDPALHDMLDGLEPREDAALWFASKGMGLVDAVGVPFLGLRVRDPDGRLAGTMVVTKPAAGMSVVGAMISTADPEHLRRVLSVVRADRRPAAILFADLESSSPLARRLPTAGYFALVRRLAGAADACVIQHGGMPGRHAGDGVVAFFLAETAGGESAAARGCIAAARALREAVAGVAERSGLAPDDVVLRFGLHWGATLYVGSIATTGRSEVTALGDEVNETARIEACATGGRALASKSLVERLDADDARALGIDTGGLVYTPLADLDTATEKARRDAPMIAVCDV